jgi:pilus assembly protein FimV
VRRFALRVVLIGLLLPGLSHALGLGEITVDSALNQPLKAEIAVLSANPDEIIDIVAQLAEPEAFDRIGLERPYGLTELQFKPAVRDGLPVIVVTTRKPVKEPFLDFLLDVRWPKGRLLREYTILLDPPVLMEQRAVATQAPTVEAAAPAAMPMAAPEPEVVEPEPVVAVAPEPEYEPLATKPEPAPEPTPAPAVAPIIVEEPAPAAEPVMMAEPAAAPLFPLIPIPSDAEAPYYEDAEAEGYTVVANDTLWEIANKNRPDDVSVNQMMMAMLYANPDAFYKNNINNLKKGVILRMPSREELEAVDVAQANKDVSDQYAVWNEYREQVAGSAAMPQESVPAVETEAAEPAAETAESAEVAQAEPEAETSLEILAPESEAATGETVVAGGEDIATLQNDLSLARESLESTRQENQELDSRVQELEAMLEKQERLINLKDEEISDLQQQVQTPVETAEIAPEPVVVEEAPVAEAPMEEAEMPAPAEEVQEPGVEMAEAELAEAPAEEMAEPAPEMGQEEAAPEAMPAESEMMSEQPVSEPVMEEQPAVVLEPEPVEPVTPQPAAPAPSLAGDMMADPKMLGIVGGGVLLVLALIALLIRRMGSSRKAAKAEEPAAVADENPFDEVAEETVEDEVVADIDETAVLDQPLEAETAEEETETQILDQPEEVAFSGDATQAMSMPGEEDTLVQSAVSGDEAEPETDDTLSEADVYLAYGLHQQCEDLLKSALDENPDRNDYRAKLLENYFAAKEKDKFEESAQELHDKLGGESSPYWDRAVVMGKELAPDNALFSGADAGGLSLDDIVQDKPEAAEFDLTSEDLGESEESPDLEIDSIDLDVEMPEEPAVEVEAGSDEGTLEFDIGDVDLGDLDLGTDDTTEDEDTATLAISEGDLNLGEDTDLDDAINIGDEDIEVELGEIEEELETEVLNSAEDDLNASLDLDESVSAEMLDTTVDADTSDKTATLDIGDMDLDIELGDTSSDSIADDLGLDEALDFSEEETETVPALDEGSIDLDDDLGLGEDLELPDSEDEVGTKLDLAKAYIDMGDTDGARNTLEEVMSEGSDEQKQEAQDLMNQIS